MARPSPKGDPALHRQLEAQAQHTTSPTPEVVTAVILGGWQAGLRGAGGAGGAAHPQHNRLASPSLLGIKTRWLGQWQGHTASQAGLPCPVPRLHRDKDGGEPRSPSR